MKSLINYLLIDRIKITAANTVSSPITYGFPAISAFLGAIHALNRELLEDWDITFDGVLISCHECHIRSYRAHAFTDYTFNQNRTPLKQNGSAPSIIEEGKCDLTLSLAIKIYGEKSAHRRLNNEPETFKNRIQELLTAHRIAGGSVQGIRNLKLFGEEDFEELTTALMPARVLMSAQDELIAIEKSLKEQNKTAQPLSTLIELATLHHNPTEDEQGKTTWATETCKKGKGWLVPIPVGFQAISRSFTPGELANYRNPEYPSQYVESIYSAGKWILPHRGLDPKSCFWRYDNSQKHLYLVTQNNH